MKSRDLLSGLCLAITLVAWPFGTLHAASRIWDGGGTDGNWATAANWDGNTVAASTDDLTFATAFTSGTTINLNGNRTANSLTIDSSTNFALASSTLTLTSGRITRSATSSGTQLVSSAVTLGASGVWDINGSGSLTVSGAIDDGGATQSITKTGSGALILTGTYGYDGGTIINGGSLTISGIYDKSNSLTTLNAGTLTLDYIANNSNKLQSTLNLSGGSLIVAGAASSYVETVTSSTITAGASNISRNGGTTILRLNGITRNIGGTLNFSTGNIADSDSRDSNGILGGWATIGGVDWAENSTNGTNGAIAAFTAYTNSVAATTTPGTTANVNFQASNTAAWNSQTINSLRFNTPSVSTLSLNAGNTLTLATGGLLVGAASGTNNQSITGGTIAGASGRDLIVNHYGSGTFTIGSIIANNGTATALTKSGGGKLILTAANTYTGQTYLNQGTLSISANSQLGAPATGATLNLDGGTLEATATFGLFNGSAGTNNRAVTLAENGGTIAVTGSNTLSVTGVVSGAGSLTKTDSGTFILSGANTFSGGTLVRTGKLLVNNTTGSGTGTGSVTVASGATLGGNGTISGATTIHNGGVHASGNGVGIQTFSNSLTYQDGSIFSWEIDRTQTQTRGIGYDAANIASTLGGAGSIFRIVIGDSDFSNSFWDTNRTWANIFTSNGTAVIASWAATFSGGFEFYNTSGTALATPSSQGNFNLSGNTLTWSAFTAVPEPSSALAAFLIAAGIMRRRRCAGGK